MAKDDDLISLGPWPAGVDTVSTDHEIAEGALRDAVNYIITQKGGLLRRPGKTKLDSGAWHSGFSCGAGSFAVRAGEIRKLSIVGGALQSTVVASGLSSDPVYFEELGGLVYWSNGAVNGVIRSGVNEDWSLPVPPLPILTPTSTGGMTAGTYLVSLAALDDLDREHGASYPVPVTVAEGGGFTVTMPSSVYRRRIYVSGPDGSELYLRTTAPMLTTTVAISVSDAKGKPLDTEGMQPFPSAKFLARFNSAIYGAVGPRLVFTEPMGLHLHKPGSALTFASDLVMVLRLTAGLLVATEKETRFLFGTGRGEFENRVVFSGVGAVPGAFTYLPNERGGGAVWQSTDGFCFVSADGAVRRLTQDRVIMDASRGGAMAYNTVNGVNQIISVTRGGLDSEATATDFYEAEIIRAR